MAFEFGQELTAGRVPDLRRLVVAGGDDALPVGGERRLPDASGMAFEFGQELTAGRVPDPRRIVYSIFTYNKEAPRESAN